MWGKKHTHNYDHEELQVMQMFKVQYLLGLFFFGKKISKFWLTQTTQRGL